MAALENVLDRTLSAGFLSNRNILTRSLSLKSRLDIGIQNFQLERRTSSLRSVCKISGETIRILSECMHVALQRTL